MLAVTTLQCDSKSGVFADDREANVGTDMATAHQSTWMDEYTVSWSRSACCILECGLVYLSIRAQYRMLFVVWTFEPKPISKTS